MKLVHTDIQGPAPISARNRARYFLTLIDDFLRQVWVFFLRKKSKIFSKFKTWKVDVEEEGCSVKWLHLDNGAKFTSREFLNFSEEYGIKRHFSVRKTL